MTDEPLFSLIVTTIGRTDELDRFIVSAATQDYKNIELIIVDQNKDDRLRAVVAKHSPSLNIRHISSAQGSSRGRNAGLALARGELVAFPDDDCEYPPGLLKRVCAFFLNHSSTDILTGMARDWDGVPVGRWDDQTGPLERANVWRRGIAFAMFLRREAMDRIGKFDEHIGPGCGTPMGAGEETDVLIRGIDLGLRTFYDPSLVVLHPNKQFTDFGVARAFGYAAGMGYVLRKNACSRSQLLQMVVRPLGGALISLLRGRPHQARYHALTLKGRLWGYFRGRPPEAYPRTGAQISPLTRS
jgi:glycosyltransferase involved in cell wall biosynthesis